MLNRACFRPSLLHGGECQAAGGAHRHRGGHRSESRGGILVFLCKYIYPEVLRPEPWGLPPSILSHSPLCTTTQITDCYWSEESFLSLTGFNERYRTRRSKTKRRAQVRPACLIFWTIGAKAKGQNFGLIPGQAKPIAQYFYKTSTTAQN